MFQIIKHYIGRFVIFILLSMLVLSFALWGIGDVFRGGGSNAIATIEGENISRETFQRALQQEENKIKSRFGNEIPEGLLDGVEVKKMVLKRLLEETLLAKRSYDVGLRVADKQIIDLISKTPFFMGKDGKFDKTRFEQYLNFTHQSEKEFITQEKKRYAIGNLIEAVASIPVVSSYGVEILYSVEKEKRIADVLRIPVTSVKKTFEASEAELSQYFENNKVKFSTKEQRQISYAIISPVDLEKKIEISDQEIEQEYEAELPKLGVPEKRSVERIIVDSEEKAKEIHLLLKQGKDFYQIAKEKTGQEATDLKLGEVTKADLPESLANTAFSLNKGSYSAPVIDDFGWHILRVTDIKPGKTPTLDEVRSRIKRSLLVTKSKEELSKLTLQIEDEIAGGAKIEEISAKYGIKIVNLESITEDGKDSNGNINPILVKYPKLLKSAFSKDSSNEPLLIELENKLQTYALLYVNSVIPARIRTLDEVKGLVIDAWQDDKKHEELKNISNEIAARVKTDSSTLENEARKLNLNIEKAKNYTRNSGAKNFTNELFKLPKGQTTSSHLNGKDEYIIGRLTNIVEVDDKELKAQVEQMKSGMKRFYINDFVESYIHYLEQQYKVTVNVNFETAKTREQ